LLEVIAIFSPSREFKRVDLPTLGRPMIAIKPDFKLVVTIIVRIPELNDPRKNKG
jgi:hypothetical protein